MESGIQRQAGKRGPAAAHGDSFFRDVACKANLRTFLALGFAGQGGESCAR